MKFEASVFKDSDAVGLLSLSWLFVNEKPKHLKNRNKYRARVGLPLLVSLERSLTINICVLGYEIILYAYHRRPA